ncbi:hypothetical protein, partial [Parapedobacter tibetensis]
DFEDLVQANETLTTLVDNGDGTVTYTDEAGTATTIALATIIDDLETVTDLVDNGDGTISYTNEDGTVQTIDIGAVVTANETVTTLADNTDGTFSYTNEAGDVVTFDANTTTMADNGDGTYTFTNANGDAITVDVPQSVVGNIQNEGDIFNEIINLIGENEVDAINGLTKVDGEIKLGGALTEPTEIITDATNTLAISGLEAGDVVTNSVVSVDPNGVLQTIDVDALAIEPWLNQADGAQATTNTQDIYQMGRVGINTASTNKQLEIAGTFKAMSGAGTQFTGIETDLAGSNATAIFHVNNANLGNATEISTVATRQGLSQVYGASAATNRVGFLNVQTGAGETPHFELALGFPGSPTPEQIPEGSSIRGTFGEINMNSFQPNGLRSSIQVSRANGIRFSYGLPSQPTFADYIFPRNNPTANQVLAAGSTTPQQLEWRDMPVSVDAAMPKFFYMPAIIIPTAADQVPSGETFGTIDLYAKYQDQFGSPMVTNTNTTTNLPVLPANELDYYITWYDDTVFTNVQVDDNGVLTYSVSPTADVLVGSFMNIVFAVK